MGISRARAWLAVATLALGSVRGDLVTFESTGFKGSFTPGIALISFEDIAQRSFTWRALSGIVVKEITLWSETTGSQLGQTVLDSPESAAPDSGSESWSPRWDTHRHKSEETSPGRLGRRNPQGINNGGGGGLPVQLTSELYSSGGQVRFTRGSQGIPTGQLLYFNATWANGSSYSQFFAASGTYIEVDDRASITLPAYRETGTPTGSPTTLTTTTAATASPEEPTNASEGGLTSSESNKPVAATPSSSGGLATGAVIGIAVACGVVGLLLILGLVWYLLRRRQQKKAMHPVDSTYGSGSRGEELMAEKEAAADVDVTPHSPYTDEGASGNVAGPSGTYPDSAPHGDTVVAGAIAAPNLSHLQDPPRSFTPYSDRPSAAGTAGTPGTAAAAAAGTPSLRAPSLAQTDEARVSVPSPIPGRATPRGLTTPYAHLVEEGMTEDEIRRLEEEERQLDAAIEQAGRR
ncbi:uncharacterized protein B0H64DRAFT_371459 [Chaetomium fimeti]|uniref:Mid2 domain-containing protein n=1 Tax=Chaetomium fimeti TaxID=1854472 RepID=A0AAE0HM55_9PEZI|nr:hypothetical protein B0H64DRAFT_371459 [Chaetomium fimeti]